MKEPGARTIIQVTWSLVAGGMETYAFRLAANLDKRKFRPVICALDSGGVLEPEVKAAGIPYHIMDRRAGIDFRLVGRLHRLFLKERASIVHTHHFNGLFYASLAARLAGARLIHTEHALVDLERRSLRLTTRALTLLCDHIVAVGDGIGQVLRANVGIPASKVNTVYAGVDPSAFGQSREAARRALGLATNVPVAVIVARLYPEKNHGLLLKAFKRVVRELPDAQLLIAGDGTEEAAIRQEIASLALGDHVHMLGARRDVPLLLAASNLLVLPSLREGLPIAVLEAMTSSLPVVATAVGDIPRVVRHEETGLLVPSDDEALAHAMITLLSNQELARRFGLAGKQQAAKFDLRTMVERYEKIYEASLEVRAPGPPQPRSLLL
jgi:L-malate glycosyltransferase